MKVQVQYSDETEKVIEGNNLAEIADEIQETVTGCDFAVTPSSVSQLDEKGNVTTFLRCDWELMLVADKLLEKP